MGGKWQRKLSDALKKNSSRPLLYSHELERRPEAAVIVVEGEKTCDAASAYSPELASLHDERCQGHREDRFDSKGRKVILWPDNDEEGRAAMERLAKVLNSLRGPQRFARGSSAKHYKVGRRRFGLVCGGGQHLPEAELRGPRHRGQGATGAAAIRRKNRMR